MVSVVTTAGLAAGQEVMIIQMQGTGAGLYEFGTIQNVGSGSVTLTANLANAYTVGGGATAQLLRVWHYQNLTVQSGGVVTAHPWDGNSGGIVVFRVAGTLTVAAGGAISVDAGGYRGAPTNSTGYGGSQGEGQNGTGVQSISANGVAGGGGCSNGYGNPSGGGGGGYGTLGTAGGPGNNNNCNVPGAGGGTIGGPDLSSTIFLGGGGGSGGAKADCACGIQPGGYGGAGGGIILGFASTATIDGTISANGASGGLGTGPNTSSNGGGGAGGSIRLVVVSATVSTPMSAQAGAGGTYCCGSTQNGGAGGAGRVQVQYCQSFSGSSNPPANIQSIVCSPPPAAPAMLHAASGGTTTTVQGTLTAAPNTTYTVALYSNTTCSTSGAGDVAIGTLTATTDASGAVKFSQIIKTLVPAGQLVQATAAGPSSGPSAFSGCVSVVNRVCTDESVCDGYTDAQIIALGKDPFTYCHIMRADVNGDSVVNILDLSAVAQHYDQLIPPAPARLDQNADGVINILDLATAAGVYQQSISACP